MEARVRDAADDAEFDRYLGLARHAFAKTPYGHEVLRAHGVAAVAARGGEVLGGGLFLPFAQHFGGRPVPSGGVAWLAVAPWERGAGLARRLTAHGTDRLRDEHGAALASAWTPAPGIYRRWGWESVTVASSHTLNPAELPQGPRGFETVVPEAADRAALQWRLAPAWNGPLRRTRWWHAWKGRINEAALTLGVTRDGALAGYVTFTVEPHPPWGVAAVVHDFWHTTLESSRALLDAVGARSPQLREIRFRRSVLPRDGPLPWALGQYAVREDGWYPWVLTLLDVPRALAARGWSEEARPGGVGLDVVTGAGGTTSYTLAFEEGRAHVTRGGTGSGTVRVPAGTLAAWYAGALPLRRAAELGMAEGDPRALARLDAHAHVRGERPWLPDSF